MLDLVAEEPAIRARLASILSPGDLLLFGGSALIRNYDGTPAAATNSLYVLDSSGTLLDRYDKAHLVPLGEYVPARPLMTPPRPRPADARRHRLPPRAGTADARAARLSRGGHPDLLRDHLSRQGRRRGASSGVDRQHLERCVVRHVGTTGASGTGAAARDRGRTADRARHADRDQRGDRRARPDRRQHRPASGRGEVAADAAAAAADAVRALCPLDEFRLRLAVACGRGRIAAAALTAGI